ncbi:AtpZ/AtpI family protein [Pseudalkalibacillus salsuginis]|uniref:AtpZ/AtpI family protein n=1 Tax=Pseudalkalibacillus salsuginis TaxID=2910972 RepID=UPI001F25DF54|nr:AtpZ/AtpI family protein [Pseudalkalibacillus salsuginis]MCF6410923.1 AtpZ/AtpI family protein [Pseudalkalibacillus salsuginis]
MRTGKRSPLHSMALMSGILSQLVGSILVGIFGGMWLDRRFGTAPFLMIVGLFIGLATGVYGMIKLIQRHFGEEEQ